jgi:hypothetical protein
MLEIIQKYDIVKLVKEQHKIIESLQIIPEDESETESIFP